MSPLSEIQHLTEQLGTADADGLNDPWVVDVLDHRGEGLDGGLLDVDDLLGRSRKRTKELPPEDWAHCSEQEAMSRDLRLKIV